MKIVLSATIAFTLQVAMGTIAAESAEALYPPEKRRKLSPGHIVYYIDPADGSDANSGVQQKPPLANLSPHQSDSTGDSTWSNTAEHGNNS